jgi:PAS domain S-box-containing protein
MVNTLDVHSRPGDEADALTAPLTAESLLALVPDAMLFVDADGVIVALNALAETLFGYAPGELVGSPVETLVPEASLRAGPMGTAEMRLTGSDRELSALRKDGREVPVEISLSPLPGSDSPLAGVMVRDITERKTVELALRFSEERLLESAEIAHIGHFVRNVEDGRMLFCSEGYARIFGCDVDECLAQHSAENGSVAPEGADDPERSRRAAYDEFLRNGDPIDTQYRITRLDGTVRHIRERTRPVRDESKQIVSAVGTIQDITDEIETNRALAESESLLTHAADVAGLGHFVWDAASEALTFVSEQYARICGRSVEECLVRHNTEAGELADVHPDDREAYGRIMHAGPAAPVIDVVYRMIRPDGEIRHVHEREDPVFDDAGQLVRYVGTLQDVTEQRMTEDRLREAEYRHELAARLAHLGHYVWDEVANRLVFCSYEYATIHGFTLDEYEAEAEARGNGDWFIHPDDFDHYSSVFDEQTRDRTGNFDLEYRVVRPDGTIRHIHEIGETDYDAEGRPLLSRGTVQDVTARVEAQGALRESEARLSEAARMAGLGHYVWNEEADRLLYCSDEYAQILGRPAEELLGAFANHAADLKFIHPDDRVRFLRNAYLTADSAEGHLDIEYRILRPDGEVRHVWEIGKTLVDDAGNALRTLGTIQDITERKRSEAQLREKDERLEQAIEISGLGHYVWDEVADRLIDCSTEYAAIHGLTIENMGAAATDSDGDLALIHPDDREDYVAKMYYGATPKIPRIEHEYRIVRPDGEVRYLHEVAEVEFDSAGNMVRTVGTVHDVTEHKRAEALLREKDEQLEQAAEMAHLGHYVWDEAADRLVSCSPEYAAIHGMTIEEELGVAPGDLSLVHPDDRDDYLANMNNVATPEAHRVEHQYRIVRPDGEVRHLHEIAEIIFDQMGGKARSLGTIQDVTERVQAEQALRDNEAHLAEATRIAQLGQLVWNEVDETLIYCSEECARIYGLSVDEMMAGPFDDQRDFTTIYPDDLETYRKVVYTDYVANLETVHHEYRIVRPDGEVRHVHLDMEPVFDAAGTLVRSTRTIQDITERKQAKALLREKDEQLEQAVKMAHLGHYVWDETADRLISCSPEYAAIHGLTIEEEFGDADGGLALIHPDDRDGYFANTNDAATPEAPRIEDQYRIIRPDGEIRHLHEIAEVMFDHAGNPVRSHGTIQDVTERVQAQQTLRENEERLAEAVRIAKLGHFVFSKESGTGRMDVVSDEYARIYGLSVEECLDTMFDFDGLLAAVHPDDREAHRKAITTDLTPESGLLDVNYRIVRPDGAIRHVRERGRPVWNADGSFRKIVGTIQDVTEENEAEQALRTSEEKFRSVIENVPGAVFRQAPDETGTFTFMSDGIRDLAGYEPGDLMGKPMEFLAHPDDYAEMTETVLDHMRSGLPMNIEYRIRHKNESTVWVREISRLVTGPGGEQISFDGVLVDISDRKLAEGALVRASDDLHESEERYARAVAGTNDAIWDRDLATDECYFSPRYYEMLGYEPGELATHFSALKERIHPDDLPKLETELRGHFDNNEPYDIEYRMRRKDGEYLWVRARGLAQRDGDGNPVRISGSTSDVTEIKLFEEQVRQSEIEFRGIFDGMPISVWYEDWSEPKKIIDGLREQGVADLAAHFQAHPELVQELYELTRVLRFNQATQEIYKADEETLWRDIDTFDFDEEREVYGDMLAAVADGSYRLNYETREYNYEDDEIAVRVNINVPAEFQDDWSRVIVTSEDVTAVKATEEQLRLSEIEFRGIFDGMPISVWYEDWTEPKTIIDGLRAEGVTDFAAHFRANPDLVQHIYEKTRVLRFNQTTMEIYKTDAETLWRDIDLFEFPEEREAYGDMLAVLAGGAYRTTFETKEFNYEDGEILVRANVHIPPEFHENWARVVVTSEDVSGARAVEDQLRQAQKMEAVGQLTGGVAHDFNNLLGIMLGNAELLADSLDDENLLSFATAIQRAAVRGADLTHGLLAFSRRQSLEPRRVDLNEMVTEFTSILQRTLGATILIETRLADGEVPANVDPNQLENALLNMTINARDAMPEGGVLHIETWLADLDAQAAAQIDAQPGHYAVLSVTDTGKGMAPEVLERVFEPFFTTKDTGKGTGLGLSMIYGFVNQSEGHITINSTEGKGTVIQLYLPAAAPDDDAQVVSADPSVFPTGQGETVLLVEDDEDFRTLSIGLLQGLGYRVLAAGDAAAAFETLAAEPAIDLVLTDVILPGDKTGADVARTVQTDRPDIPVLFMSGYTAGHLDALRSDDAPDLPLIQKPFSRHVLAHRLHEILHGTATE